MNDIAWQDMLIAEDALIESLQQKLHDDPEHGKYWQDRIATENIRRQEIHAQAEQEFMQSIAAICENVLKKSKENGSE